MIHHTTGYHHLGEEGAVHLAREVLAQDGGEAVHDRLRLEEGPEGGGDGRTEIVCTQISSKHFSLRLERHVEGTYAQKPYVRRYPVSISARQSF